MNLERTEDFKRAAEALINPNAKPHAYIVQPYGYCVYERKVTPYRGELGPEGGTITCLSCNQSCDRLYSHVRGIDYYVGDFVPQRFALELERLHSRKNQARELKELAQRKRDELRNKESILRRDLQRVAQDIVDLSDVFLTAAQIVDS